MFNIKGHSYEEWLHDIKLCANKLAINSEIQKAEEAMRETKPFMDADMQADQVFDKFSSFLS